MRIVSMIVLLVLACLTTGSPVGFKRKEKRGVAVWGPRFDVFGVLPAYPGPWAGPFVGPWTAPLSADLALEQIETQAAHDVALQALNNAPPGTPTIAYTPEILRSIQSAKEANQNVHLAQNRVAEAKEAAVTQQKIALAKEAAAREATQRSEAIAAHSQAEARASAQQLVALQQRLASLKDAVAAAQRVAAARETAAAAAIQRNAAETAAELKKQAVDRQITDSEREAKARDIAAAKETAIAKAVHHAAVSKPIHQPWA